MVSLLDKIFKLLSSYGFAVVTIFFLFLLTLLGTLEQVNHGLFEVQKRYFESIFLIHHFGPVPVPLPGVYLLMILLFINLSLGAIIRAPKQWKRPGLLISHFGILFLLVGGFVTFKFSENGYMALVEGEQSDVYQSYHEWEILIAEAKPGTANPAHVLRQHDFDSMQPNEDRTFYAGDLPFELTLSGFEKNCVPLKFSGGSSANKIVDGYYVQPVALDAQAEMNQAGVYVTAKSTTSDQVAEGILWGGTRLPFVLNLDDTSYAISLGKRKWRVPFTVRLEDFIHEKHPNTGMPAKFISDVKKIENGAEQDVRISMNKPLRHKGFTFFQASFGQTASGAEQSVFAVARNPADHWPLYSCYIVSFGLLLHFGQLLFGYLRREAKRRASNV